MFKKLIAGPVNDTQLNDDLPWSASRIKNADFVLGIKRRERIGVVLSGGGANGAYEAGLLCSLVERSVIKTIDVISGSSIGALNALFLAEQLFKRNDLLKAVHGLRDLWLEIDLANQLGAGKLELLARLILKERSIFEVDAIQKVLNRYIPTGRTIGDYRSVGLKVLITGTNLNMAREEVLPPEMNAIEAVLMSSAFPGVFPAREYHHSWYNDGGVLDNTPLKPCIRAGATRLWVLYLAKEEFLATPNVCYKKLLDNVLRTIDLLHQVPIYTDVRHIKMYNDLLRIAFSLEKEDQKENVLDAIKFIKGHTDFMKRVIELEEIFPEAPLGATFNFDKDNIASLVKAGERRGISYAEEKSAALLTKDS